MLKNPEDRGERSQAITRAIEKAQPQAIEGQQLWRGIRGIDRSTVDVWLRTGQIEHYGTASTSRSKQIALNFAGLREETSGSLLSYGGSSDQVAVLYRLKNKTGVPVETISNYASEQEVMVKAGVKYRITNAYKGPNSNGNVIVIEAEEL